jgi:uncharacterized protein (TIGR04168 family)
MPLHLAILGDVHRCFDARDVELLDAQGYDAALFVGDLAGYRQRGGLVVAKHIARLRTPALVMPGNHDGPTLLHLAAEVFGWRRLAPLLGGRMHVRVEQLKRALGPVPLVGYSLHEVGRGAQRLSVVAARPHSMGGHQFPFAKHMARHHRVRSHEESARRLCELVDRAPHPQLVFLAHNGPTGLGDGPDAPFGRDFPSPFEGAPQDWGDADLEAAVTHARATGKQVAAVVAGHMHHAVRGGGRRPMAVQRDGTLYVNAARVPRIREREGVRSRHHVRLEWDAHGARATEVWLEG